MIRYSLLLLLLLFNCTDAYRKNTIFKPYPYEEQLDNYFQEQLDHNSLELLRKEFIKYFFILPLDSCTDCLTETLENIIRNKQVEVGVLFLGRSKNVYHEELKNEVEKINHHTHIRLDNAIQLYETNVFGPTIFTVENKQIKYIPLTNEIWQKLIVELGWD